MEDYLVKDYGVISNEKWLKDETQIEDFFRDVAYDYLDCGQGYYEDEATLLAMVGEKFYEVKITAEIGSSKQDRGDRLYFVEDIESVTWKEVDKPLPKDKSEYTYTLLLDAEQKVAMDKYLESFMYDNK